MLQAGGDPARVVFSGVGKTAAEIELALRSGILNFNCESEAELAEIDAVAEKLGVTARFSLRVNPDVDAATHPYISTGLRDHKFGIDIAEAPAVYHRAKAFRTSARQRRELPYRFADSGLFVDSGSRGQGAGAD